MKKIFTLIFCALTAFVASAQIEIVKDGNVVKDGETIVFYAIEEELFPGFSLIECSPVEPLIKNVGSSTVDTRVTVEQENANDFTWCMAVDKNGNLGIGSCQPIFGKSETKPIHLPAGKSVGLDLHAMNFTSGEYKTYTAQVTVAANNKTQKFTIKFVYDKEHATGIEETQADQVTVANNQLSYSFSDNADRQLNIYGVSGRLVKSESLSQNGVVALNGLHRGVYIYEITANGKRTSAHKFVVK